MFSGMFKKSPKPFRAKPQSQVSIMESCCRLFSSQLNHVTLIYSDGINNHWLTFVSHLQGDLSAPSELSGSNDNLSDMVCKVLKCSFFKLLSL